MSKSRQQRERRQGIFNKVVLATLLVIIVIVTAYAFTRPTSVALPSYLDRCISLSGPFAYDSVPQLKITVGGQNQTIPRNIGVIGSCVRPIHTFTPTGTIHIDTDVNRVYTLNDFFLVWGNTYGPQYATFNQNQLFNYRADSSHSITMVVNNKTDTSDFQNLAFPTNANSTSNPFQVWINYG